MCVSVWFCRRRTRVKKVSSFYREEKARQKKQEEKQRRQQVCVNESIRDCLYSRATSRLIVCIRNVQMIMSGYDFLKSQVLSC